MEGTILGQLAVHECIPKRLQSMTTRSLLPRIAARTHAYTLSTRFVAPGSDKVETTELLRSLRSSYFVTFGDTSLHESEK
jgi:hypothetical protein